MFSTSWEGICKAGHRKKKKTISCSLDPACSFYSLENLQRKKSMTLTLVCAKIPSHVTWINEFPAIVWNNPKALTER